MPLTHFEKKEMKENFKTVLRYLLLYSLLSFVVAWEFNLSIIGVFAVAIFTRVVTRHNNNS